MGQSTVVGTALTDAFLGRIYRASSTEARRLSLTLTQADRARLAIFCNSKAHLRDQGRAIATACTPESLIQQGGTAGRILLDQAAAAPDKWDAVAHTDKRISLAGGTWLSTRADPAR